MAGKERGLQRSRFLSHGLIGQSGLLRELGLVDARSRMSAAWSTGLEANRSRLSVPMLHRVEFTTMVSDEIMHRMILGFRANEYNGRKTAGIDFQPFPDHAAGLPVPSTVLFGSDTIISSISLSPSRIMLVTELDYGSLPFCIKLASTPGGDPNDEMLGSECVPNTTPNVRYRASAANPHGGTTSFAVAVSCGVLVVSGSQDRWTTEFSNGYPYSPVVAAVDWLSRNVVIRGDRDGGVRLWDLRSGGESRESRIQHPSLINHARRIDDNTIVVAGLESKLRVYDLRFPSIPAGSEQVTTAYNQLLSYQNMCMELLMTGFDVHGDIAAAVTDDARVIIWDAKRALELKQIGEVGGKLKRGGMCVRFVGGQEDGKALGLVTASRNWIREFSW